MFKYPKGAREPSLVLGKAFEPGNDEAHFCKPTDVAVASNGAFFVADGYLFVYLSKPMCPFI